MSTHKSILIQILCIVTISFLLVADNSLIITTEDMSLSYLSYMGGNDFDTLTGGAAGEDTLLYVGWTQSNNMSTTIDGDASLNGSMDAFYSIVNYNQTILFASYLGGSSDDQARSATVDTEGNYYILGSTQSTDFPITLGTLNETYIGGEDVFITKISDSGEILASSFFGGTGREYGDVIKVDGHGNLIIIGSTTSNNLPVTNNAYDTTYNDYDDIYIANISNDLTTLHYCSYLGGSDSSEAPGDFLLAGELMYIVGRTRSNDYPVTDDAYQPQNNNTGGVFAHDAVISILNMTSNTMLYSTYYGGSYNDIGNSLFIDDHGNPTIIGETGSNDLVTTPGADQTIGGYSDGFVFHLNLFGYGEETLKPDAQEYYYASYLGSSYDEAGGFLLKPVGPNAENCTTFLIFDQLTTSGKYQPSLYEMLNDIITDADPAVGNYFTHYAITGDSSIEGTIVWGRADPEADWCAYRIIGNTPSDTIAVSSDAFQKKYGGGYQDGFIATLHYTITYDTSTTSSLSSSDTYTSNPTDTSSESISSSEGTTSKTQTETSTTLTAPPSESVSRREGRIGEFGFLIGIPVLVWSKRKSNI
ncbi:MAG: SBBP repeat-containing protein [Candidatus Heimdallarchaeota archaeon]|nr:SBBP repeat-containing protein [Candidatus Heimdallarchaeota archaeon]